MYINATTTNASELITSFSQLLVAGSSWIQDLSGSEA
jgi:hypothetical protein